MPMGWVDKRDDKQKAKAAKSAAKHNMPAMNPFQAAMFATGMTKMINDQIMVGTGKVGATKMGKPVAKAAAATMAAPTPAQFAGAAELGSQEAYSAIVRAQGLGGKDSQKVARDSLAEQKKQTSRLDILAKSATRGRGAVLQI
jgi:hypothetical protein